MDKTWDTMEPLERLTYLETNQGCQLPEWVRRLAQEAQEQRDQETPHA